MGEVLTQKEFTRILQSKNTKKPLPKEFSIWTITPTATMKVRFEYPQQVIEDSLECNVKKVEGKYLTIKCFSEKNNFTLFIIVYYDKEKKAFISNTMFPNAPINFTIGKVQDKNKVIWKGQTPQSKSESVETIEGKKISIKEKYFDLNDKFLYNGFVEVEYK